jgi:hypothetical protein
LGTDFFKPLNLIRGGIEMIGTKSRQLAALALWIAITGTSYGQDYPRTEVFLGYPFLAGIQGSATFGINRWLGIVGDYSYRVAEYYADKPLHTFGVGPRLTARFIPGVTPFAHVLFGLAGSGCADWSAEAGCLFGTTSAIVLGGGLDIRAGRVFSVRAFQIDYMRTRFGSGSQTYPGLSFGLVFRPWVK